MSVRLHAQLLVRGVCPRGPVSSLSLRDETSSARCVCPPSGVQHRKRTLGGDGEPARLRFAGCSPRAQPAASCLAHLWNGPSCRLEGRMCPCGETKHSHTMMDKRASCLFLRKINIKQMVSHFVCIFQICFCDRNIKKTKLLRG